MKFRSLIDKQMFLLELEMSDKISDVNEAWEPTPELLEVFFKRRKSVIKGIANFRRSQAAKASWRRNRYTYLKGIGAFHKSTEGKRFHRSLGRFLATRVSRDGHGSIFSECLYESLKALSSLKTHVLIEMEYYHPVEEQIELEFMIEDVIPAVNRIEESLLASSLDISDPDLDLIYRMCNESDLKSALSAQTGVDIKQIEEVWESEKTELMSSDNKVFEEIGFYKDLVDSVKQKIQA